MEAIIALVVVPQTQPFHQSIWPNVSTMGTIERPFVQRNISITTTQPTIEVALTCAYY
jgi:hypothetical protein